jgi:hypothetical protein
MPPELTSLADGCGFSKFSNSALERQELSSADSRFQLAHLSSSRIGPAPGVLDLFACSMDNMDRMDSESFAIAHSTIVPLSVFRISHFILGPLAEWQSNIGYAYFGLQ